MDDGIFGSNRNRSSKWILFLSLSFWRRNCFWQERIFYPGFEAEHFVKCRNFPLFVYRPLLFLQSSKFNLIMCSQEAMVKFFSLFSAFVWAGWTFDVLKIAPLNLRCFGMNFLGYALLKYFLEVYVFIVQIDFLEFITFDKIFI